MVSQCIYGREFPLSVSQESPAALLLSTERNRQFSLDFGKIKLFPCFSTIYLLISSVSSIESCIVSFSDSVSKCSWFMRIK